MRKEWVFVFSLLILAVILIPIRTVVLADAASNNLANALSILEKGEPLFYRRGPVYYGLIAIFFHLFGIAVEHAVWVTRLFVPLNIAIVYVITRSMLNVRAAVIASLLVFFSYPLNLEASKLELDNIMPFFMLLALWLSWLAAKRQSMSLAIASGFTLGVGWLVKEAAILFLPICFIPFLFHSYRNKKALLLACLTIAAFVATLLPWFGYALSKGNDPITLFGAASPSATVERHSDPNISYLKYILDYFVFDLHIKLYNYFENYFRAFFPLWLPLLIGLFYALVMAFRKRSLELGYLLGGILLFSPIAIFQGGFGERLGQCYVIFLILYILLANWCDSCYSYDISQILPRRSPRLLKDSPKLIGVALVVFFVSLDLVNPFDGGDRSTLFLWTLSDQRSSSLDYLLKKLPEDHTTKVLILSAVHMPPKYLATWKEDQGTSGFVLQERWDEGIQEAAAWMIKNIPADSKIAVDGHLTEAVPFYTRFSYPVVSFDAPTDYNAHYETSLSFSDATKGRLLGAVTYHGFRNTSVARYRVIFLYFERPILDRISNFGARYLFVFKASSSRIRYTHFYEDYFRTQKSLINEFENRRAVIFRITSPLEPLDPRNNFFYRNSSFADDMDWLEANFPDEYEKASDVLMGLKVPINQ